MRAPTLLVLVYVCTILAVWMTESTTTAIKLSAGPSASYAYSDKDDDSDSEEDDEEDRGRETQFQITGRMKRTLMNELGYLELEVEEMEPQIAAVVIEKKLARPYAGMPASWKATGRAARRRQYNKIMRKNMKKFGQNLKVAIIKSAPIVLPLIAAGVSIPLIVINTKKIGALFSGRSRKQRTGTATVSVRSVPNAVKLAPPAPRGKKTKKAASQRINYMKFDRLTRPSVADRLAMLKMAVFDT
jgi:hypothetical protein